MELKKIQKDIWQNKLNKGFNTTDVNKEFCLLYGEVSEAYDAWKKKKDYLNEDFKTKINNKKCSVENSFIRVKKNDSLYEYYQ